MNKNKCIISLKGTLLMIMGSVAWFSAGFVQGETCLVKDGKSCADIVIAEKPPRMVKLAAEELQTYIEKISGAKLVISNAPGQDVPTHIYVGRSEETDKLKITDEGLKHGAFKMVSGENWLVLLGHDSDYTPPMPFYDHNKHCGIGRSSNEAEYMAKEWDPDLEARARQQGTKIAVEKWGSPYRDLFRQYSRTLGIWEADERGSLNAVYAFLRDQGIRWYLPGDLGEIVQKKTNLELPRVDKTVQPDFAMRYSRQYGKDWFCEGKDEILWQLRMGFNRASDVIGSAYGVGIAHGICNVFGREGMEQAHPEYYAKKRDGTLDVRRPCLSSPALLESNVKYIRALFDFYGEPMVSVMMPDGYATTCQCELCRNKGTPERGMSGFASDYVWDYVNRVAQELYKTHPDKKINCCAYGGYRLPPTKIEQLSPNIVVGLTQARSRDFNDYSDPKQKERMLNLRQEWLKKLPKGHTPFFTYDYYLDGFKASFMPPVFFPHTIAADLHALKGISLGEYIETYSGGGSKSLGQDLGVTYLNLYVSAQFWWNADQDVDKLLNEYYKLFYGPAAIEMKALVDYGEANISSWDGSSLEKNADKVKIGQAFTLLEKAQAKVAPDSVYAKRIALIADNMRPMKDIQNQPAVVRGPVPEASGVTREAKDLKLDGKLDDVFWQGLESYELKELKDGLSAKYRTTFKVAWAGDNLYFGIECKDAARASLAKAVTRHDDLAITEGEEVEIILETQNHSYYHLAISPGGGLFDADWKNGLDTLWESNAELSTHVDGDTWSAEIRIPVVDPMQEKIQPMLCVTGNKPSASAPWYFNVCRQGFGEKGHEASAFSPTGSGRFHVPLKFGKLYIR